MIFFFLFLGSVLSQLYYSDCEKVINAWRKLGKEFYLDKSCCEMDGVICDKKLNVIAISWVGLNLVGVLPLELFKLPYLTYLYLIF